MDPVEAARQVEVTSTFRSPAPYIRPLTYQLTAASSMDVLLFRTPSESDPYDSTFAAAGYKPRSVQALDDVLLPEGLAPILAAGGGRWEAALITSRRAAEAWCLAIKDAQKWPSENFGS